MAWYFRAYERDVAESDRPIYDARRGRREKNAGDFGALIELSRRESGEGKAVGQ
jgi:hypothetical protein